MPISLKDQVVLVVGASSGIGRETAALFARDGARVMASARRQDRLKALQTELANAGHNISILPADASKPNDMDRLGQKHELNSAQLTFWYSRPAQTRPIAQ